DFTETVDPGSLQPEDFKLSMAGADRQVGSVVVHPDGTPPPLASSGWRPGEAGYVEVAGVGAYNDAVGNAALMAPRIRVAAAPGDLFSPFASELNVPKTICLTHARKCRKTGMVITFLTTEAGKAR